MKPLKPLIDHQSPAVQARAAALIRGKSTVRQQLESIFLFVRDEIRFGFPPNGDLVSASETLELGYGQCNTKCTLFVALCRVAGIPARVHFSLIRREIQQGLFDGWLFRLLPPLISHGWVEVEVEGRWRRIDAFINDRPFYEAAKRQLRDSGWDTGYSIACSSGSSSIDFTIDDERFVQMDAVVEDHGLFDEPATYYASDAYANRPGFFKLLVYRACVGRINRRVEALRRRATCATGMCGAPVAS